MTTDTPVARIEAAIGKLERLKAESTPGPWKNGGKWYLEGVHHRVVRGAKDAEVAFTNDADAELIVTLHATIDAQLRLLQCGMAADWEHPKAVDLDVLALADAINGGGGQ